MKKFKIGQAEIVSTVLIFGIVVSLVGATYIWGVPLIRKQQAFGESQQIEEFMRSLDSTIQNVDKGGEDSRDTFRISENGILSINETANTIEFSTYLKGTYYTATKEGEETAWNPVEWGPEEKGIFGKDSPSIIRAKASPQSGGGYEILWQIKYRPLLISGEDKDYTIDIQTSGDDNTAIVEDELTVSNNGKQIVGDATNSQITISINE